MSKKTFKKIMKQKHREFVSWSEKHNYYAKMHLVDPLTIEYE